MPDESVLDSMRADWNQRAQEDANYYVAFGRRNQPEAEFFESAADVVRLLETELRRRDPQVWREGSALEIGCGPGRLMRPMSRHFQRLYGVDVSDEMIRRAEHNLRGLPNVTLSCNRDSTLAPFPDGSIDFIYSYAVFQHIPSREVVEGYLSDAIRILRPGGLFVFQINGLRDTGHAKSTWDGVRVGAEDIMDLAGRWGVSLLALNDPDTQYMWVTLRKPLSRSGEQPPPSNIRRLENCYTGEPLIPAAGRFGSLSIWLDNLPDDCDLLSLTARIDGTRVGGCYVSPPTNGLHFFNVVLPRGTRTGLVPVDVEWKGQRLCPAGWARVVPAAPRIPRVCSLTDGIDLLSDRRIVSGVVKLIMEEVLAPETLRIALSGAPIVHSGFCVNPLHERYEFNFRVPAGTPNGCHTLELVLGTRVFAPVPLEIAVAAG